jgi:hypothetical protein
VEVDRVYRVVLGSIIAPFCALFQERQGRWFFIPSGTAPGVTVLASSGRESRSTNIAFYAFGSTTNRGYFISCSSTRLFEAKERALRDGSRKGALFQRQIEPIHSAGHSAVFSRVFF